MFPTCRYGVSPKTMQVSLGFFFPFQNDNDNDNDDNDEGSFGQT